MNGLSLLATTISVLSFPIAVLALLYPRMVSPKGRWRGFFFYLGISVTTLFLAVWTATGPNVGMRDWTATDWLALLIGGGLFLAVLTRKWWRSATPENDSLHSQNTHLNHDRNRLKHSRKRKTGKIPNGD